VGIVVARADVRNVIPKTLDDAYERFLEERFGGEICGDISDPETSVGAAYGRFCQEFKDFHRFFESAARTSAKGQIPWVTLARARNPPRF
jgi:hypothetical protein